MRDRKKFTPRSLQVRACESAIHDTSIPLPLPRAKATALGLIDVGWGESLGLLEFFFLGMSSLDRNYASSATPLFTAQMQVLLIDSLRILCLLLEKQLLKIVTQFCFK